MWRFLLIYLVPFSVVAGYALKGVLGTWATFATPIAVFGVIPIIDLIVGFDTENVPEDLENEKESEKIYRYITWGCAPVQILVVGWGLYITATRDLSFFEFLGLSVSMGVSSGVMGINVSHELAHRVGNKLEPFLSKLILWSVMYMHWGLEHVVGHHRHVATPGDPATAKLGQSFYKFWPQTVFGSFRSALDFEATRLGKQNIPVKSWQNRAIQFMVFQGALVLFVLLFAGFSSLVYLLIQSFVAISLLEVVNYVEHYGLLRKEIDGKYESVKPWHSWNSSNLVTNTFLFNLQRHSDHHYKPGRRYQILRHFDVSPQLPTGYAGMINLALIPPLWRSIMDPKVMELREKDPEAEFKKAA